ncbi:MAG TPA: bifunctional diaminohydroxyphosphoribosylaminopyrimidine deaminase/5-amino-6-(5-phosphoribosylamino)uracil reductase RibD [Cyclobacteriaceae bacterium]|nr:bifunctional diaminohydroxyphosphoribosylaminopyrimidine deaminase/5-amino-6-(5-phosphoribosylamino)uracil reductase RibD [Cyclobacteriaceae bacterium]
MKNHDHHTDEHFMKRAMELAIRGRGYVSPNPMVGCVVVHEFEIIAEGWHEHYGQAHAEVNAVRSVENKELLKHCAVYVNLEPCSHYGKTPPCVDMLIDHKVKKVVVANLDSNPLVAGDGIKKLRSSGIEVITGILEPEGRELNKRFFTFYERQRPYIILKWAQTSDGFIARENYDSKWISNDFSRQLVHKWRAEEDAVMVGTRTALLDNPKLNVRDWTGRNPVRVVVDRFLRLNDKLQVFDGTQKTICYNLLKHEEHRNLSLARLDEQDFLQNMVNDLYRRSIQSVLVEGGSQLLSAFIALNLWDEARVFVSTKSFGKGVEAPALKGRLDHEELIDNDILKFYFPINAKGKPA